MSVIEFRFDYITKEMKNHNGYILLFVPILLLLGCTEDQAKNKEQTVVEEVFKGTIEDIKIFYTPELVDALEDLGFLFNTGGNPPIIEGTYFVSPFILEASTMPGDTIGKVFADQKMMFSNQNNEELTIDFQIEGGDQLTVGKGSFISGSDNKFSVFLISQSRTGESVLVDTAVSITGQIDSEGIRNLQWAGSMLDDKGDPDDLYITNNTGRLIYDFDKISPSASPTNKRILNQIIETAF